MRRWEIVMTELKRTWAEISLDNLEHNYRTIRRIIGDSVKFLGVVKADAYGHGALMVARTLSELGADYLAVSSLDEARELRGGGITMPILILGHTPHEMTDELLKFDITQTVTCEAKAHEYQAAAKALGGKLKIHIKLDTGMSRLGFLCGGEHFSDCVNSIRRTVDMDSLDVEGIFTHFSVSDEDGEESKEYTLYQLGLFRRVLDALKSYGIEIRLRHCANSGAVARFPESYLDMVRPGLLTYGYGEDAKKLGLRPVMSERTVIGTIKVLDGDSSVSYGRLYRTGERQRIGVLPIGYADGLFRSLSDGYEVSLSKGKAKILGRICMDMCMIDLSEHPESEVGDEVEIFGPSSPIEKAAEYAGTIPYEITCAVSKRVPRVYIRNGKVIKRELTILGGR